MFSLITALTACQSAATPAFSPPPTASSAPASWPPLAPFHIERTEDGVPIVLARPGDADVKGGVRWLSSRGETLEYPTYEATDGGTIYFAVRNNAQEYHDVLVRGGKVYEDVLAGLVGDATNPGGCAATQSGELILSAPRSAGTRKQQVVWRVPSTGGAPAVFEVPESASAEEDCTAWLDADRTFALGLFGIVTWDGAAFHNDPDWYAGRTVMGSAHGQRWCFASCNAHERAATPPETAARLDLLGRCDAEWTGGGGWIAGVCRGGGRAVRWKEGLDPEVLEGLPTSKATYSTPIALTDRGDLIVGLDYGFATYVVWRAGGTAASPVRTLAAGDRIARASPTALIRGLSAGVPEAELGTAAVVLGPNIGFGANGPTIDYASFEGTVRAHVAQVERARAVLPARPLWVAHEAVIDPTCGTYVRSPIGWEGAEISDWVPPVLPALHAAAVTPSPTCTPLAQVATLPGDRDLLLGRTTAGDLVGAWLPPPLPLPRGESFGDRNPEVEPPSVPPQHPKPGTGWIPLGRVDALEGAPASPEPGDDTRYAPAAWQIAGAALLRSGAAEILVTRHGAMTLPPGTVPMAVDPYHLGAWGALSGGRLVVCDAICRVVDPGVGAEITTVVPRTPDQVILGYSDGRVGIFTVPTDGVAITQDPLVPTLTAFLKTRPAPE